MPPTTRQDSQGFFGRGSRNVASPAAARTLYSATKHGPRRSPLIFPLKKLALLLIASPVLAQDVTLVVSSSAGDRLAAQPRARFAEGGDGSDFQLDEGVTYQKIEGFGAAFNEAGLISLNCLPGAEQEKVLAALFDPDRGAGFSAMKVDLGANDFASAGPWFSYAETPGDVALRDFSIDRDLGPNGIVTYVKRAQRHGRFLLQAYMDYPPDWMLVDADHFQDVDEKYFDALARYYLRYTQAYADQGLTVDYLSPFNEPGIYTKIPYWKIRDLLKNHLGPTFAAAGSKTKLQMPEAVSRAEAYWNYPTILDDPAARQYITNIPFHGYDGPEANTPWAAVMLRLHARYPDLPLWMTEYCHAYQAGTPRSRKLPALGFDDADFWGNRLFTDLEAFTSLWLYWNMILDQNGGPWAVSPRHGNPDANVQHGLVIIDRQRRRATYTGAYWYLAHFSKFVRPGAERIACAGSTDRVRCLAFRTAGGEIVAQLLNSRPAAVTTRLAWRGRRLNLELKARSLTTARWTR